MSHEANPNPKDGSSGDSQPESDPLSNAHDSASNGQKPVEAEESSTTPEETKENEDILALLAIKEGELENKDKEIKKLHDSLLRSYAEMENLRDRTRREIESARKFAVQEFAKSLLDVADNLSRASSVTKDGMQKAESTESKTSSSSNSQGAENLLQSLLDGVDMTQKQLMQVFKKHDLVQYDPIDQVFDPNFHNALFEIMDPTKTPGTIAVVTKTGYTLNDRVIRPAEVGVVKDPNQ